ncbi:PAS domain S-box protein, partial [Nitrospirota bacterium]
RYQLLVENIYSGFALHEIILDENNIPVDYIFLEVNNYFEEMTGLKKAGIIGRRATEVLPGIKESEFDWIGTYGNVALTGQNTQFEHFFEPLGRWYSVSAYGTGNNKFVTVCSEISARMQGEQELRKNQDTLRSLMDSSTDGIVAYDMDFRLTFCNLAMANITGFNKDAVLGKVVFDVFPFFDEVGDTKAQNLATRGRSTLRSGVHFNFPETGRSGYFEISTSPLFNSEGIILGGMGTISDVTERKKMEMEMLESQARWRSLIENAPDIIFTTDRDGIITFINYVPEGLSIKNAIGTNAIDYVPEEYREIVDRAIEIVFETGQSTSYEIVARGANDMLSCYATNVGPIMSNGEVIAVMMISRDISESKRADEALRNSEEQLRSIAETSPDYIMNLDREGKILFINRAAPGLKVENVIGMSAYDFIDDKNKTIMKECVEGVLESGSQGMYVISSPFTDGKVRYIESRVGAVKDPSGVIVGVTINATDISERRQAENKLRESEETARNLLDELRMSMDNIKTLSGLIPVCSSCKDIRDDNGYWSRIDEYIPAHLDIKCSQSICPDCSKRLYPENEFTAKDLPVLSKREIEVLTWISKGKNTWDISQLLGISENTVKFHVTKLMRKLDVSSRPQAVSIAMELGILDSNLLPKQIPLKSI